MASNMFIITGETPLVMMRRRMIKLSGTINKEGSPLERKILVFNTSRDPDLVIASTYSDVTGYFEVFVNGNSTIDHFRILAVGEGSTENSEVFEHVVETV